MDVGWLIASRRSHADRDPGLAEASGDGLKPCRPRPASRTPCAYFKPLGILNSMVVKPLGGTFTNCDTGLNTAVGVTVTSYRPCGARIRPRIAIVCDASTLRNCLRSDSVWCLHSMSTVPRN